MIAYISPRSVTPGGGIGYDWCDYPLQHFHTEAGISWLYRDYSKVPVGTSSASRKPLPFAWPTTMTDKLNEKVTFFHNFEYFPWTRQHQGLLLHNRHRRSHPADR